MERLADNTEVAAAIAAVATDVRDLGRTTGDLPIWCAVGGGSRPPPILVTAGAHADETSGPLAAVQLLRDLATDHPLYVVPTRDPLGLEGFAAVVRGATSSTAPLVSWEDVAAVLRRQGRVLVEDGSFVLALVGDLGVAGLRPTPDSFGSEKALRIVQEWVRREPALLDELAGKRVVVPANAPGCEGRGVLERAYTAYVAPDGFVGSYNRFFGHPAAPIEVRLIQDLVDDLRPGLAIDLHEGWDDRAYWFVPQATADDPARARGIEAEVIAALGAADLPTSTLSELVPNMPDEHLRRFVAGTDGRLTWRWPSVDASPWGVAFMPYALRHGLAYQTEVGRWSSVARRVEYQVTMASAMVRGFAAVEG